MTALRTNHPELEDVVITALADHLNEFDEYFRKETKRDRLLAKGIIRATGVLKEDEKRTRFYASVRPTFVGYGYDLTDPFENRRYEIALIRTKGNSRDKVSSEQFVAEGIVEGKYGWYITKIE